MQEHVFTAEEATRMIEHRERVLAEEAEWAAARLHHKLHGNWLGEDECPTCLYDSLNVEGDPAFNGAFNRW